MASTYLTKTCTASNRKTFTISTWVKRSALTVNNTIYAAGTNDATDRDYFVFLQDSGEEDKLYFNAKVSNSAVAQFYTTRRFRDTSAWYHIVLAFDTTQATDTNRMKLYVNGEQQTYQSVTYPSQNQDMNTNNTVHTIGSTVGPGQYFNGLMSHFHFIDGTAYPASTFGSTDSTTGIWKINTSPTVTYGTNGFFILKNGNGVTDQSGNSNNFTVGAGQITDLKDNPSNNFCNINLLYNQTTGQGVTVNNCGNTVYYASDSSRSCFGSIAPSSGKYYFECKVFDKTRAVIGIVNMAWDSINGASGYGYHDSALNFGYDLDGNKTSGGSASSFGSALNNNDIVQVAMDLDNSKLYFGINGTWQSSGDPTSGSTGTGSAYNLVSGANYTGACRLRAGTQLGFNFGNGQYSGSSVVASEGTNASGIGKFEYDVPTGYTALSTKGLNE